MTPKQFTYKSGIVERVKQEPKKQVVIINLQAHINSLSDQELIKRGQELGKLIYENKRKMRPIMIEFGKIQRRLFRIPEEEGEDER